MPNVKTAIEQCLLSGSRLLEDAELLHGCERHSTALAVAVLAQEEFAKAFLLQLVQEGCLPWDRSILRALNSHVCKHLAGVVMEWLAVPVEEQLTRARAYGEGRKLDGFPTDVANALNILRYEKVEKFRKGYSCQEEDWSGAARKLAEGLRDQLKQRALYVSVGATGWVTSLPTQVSAEEAAAEIERAKHFKDVSRDAAENTMLSLGEYELLKGALPLVFDVVPLESEEA